MSVRIKIFLCLVGVALVLWGSTAQLATRVFLERFDQLDTQRVRQTLGRVREGLRDRERQMISAVSLWLKDSREVNFEKSAFEFLSEFDMNALVVVSASGRVENIMLRHAPGGEGRLTATDEAAIADLVHSLGKNAKGSGLVMTSLGPMLYAADSDPLGISAVAGIFVGGEYERFLRNSLLSELSILSASGSLMDLFRGQSAEAQLSVVPAPEPGSNEVSAYSLMRDAKGEPLLILKVSEARHSYLDGTAHLRFFLGLSAAVAVVTILLATLLVEALVTGRIRRLTNSARRADINNMDDLPERFVRGNDEISTLARATKLMVDRLKNSQLLYRAVVETQRELIVRFKPDGEITLANEAFAKFFGRHLRGVIGKNLKDFFTPASLGGGSILDGLPTEANRSNIRDFKVLLENGEECWLQWSQRALVADDHTITEIQAAGHDITLRLDYANKLKDAKEAAESANRAKSEFLTVMSHETRTPLTSILGLITILQSTPLTTEQAEYLDLIRSSGNSLLVLLNDLLDYSNVASGKIELNPETIQVAALTREIVATQTPEARARKIDLDFDIEAETPAYIQADPGRLRQVLHNVVSNAIKFTARGFVRLSVKPGSNRMVDFLIQDTGIGIPEDALPRLFQAFGTADGSHSRGHGGAGIGLAVTQKALACMGGSISVRSQPGIGSLFTISVPIGNPDVKEPSTVFEGQASIQADATISDFSKSSVRVLVVDDNNVNRKVLSRLLKMIGIDCDSASSGRQCLEMTAKDRYNIVFMDIQMPEMDGYETVAKLRERETGGQADKLHIIACTAFALPGDREKCLSAGMNDYVSKPVRVDKIQAAINAYLAGVPEVVNT
jgi:PAS domain S-box-containing protein